MVKEKKLKEKISKPISEEYGIKKVSSISELETEIMKIIWKLGKATVREVHEYMLKEVMKVKESGFIPYTTVMATMATLAEKGFLKQDKSNKTFIYSPAVNNKELSLNIISTVADKLFDSASKELIYKFLNVFSEVPIEKINQMLDDLNKRK